MPGDTWAGEKLLSFQDYQHLPHLSRLPISICYVLCHYTTYQSAALGTSHTDTSQRCSHNGFSQRDCPKHPVPPDAHPPLETLCCYRTCAP